MKKRSGRDTVRGSMTIEAALIVPIFLFLIINLISAVELICLDVKLEAGLSEVGREMANYSYVLSALEQVAQEKDRKLPQEGNELIRKAESMILAQGYARMALIEQVGSEYLDHSMIVGGSDGIWLWRSSVLEEDDRIDLVVTYRVRPYFWPEIFDGMQFMKRCCIKGFSGYTPSGKKDESKKVYYITKDSDVYHTSVNCTHLKLSVSGIEYERLKDCRNQDGARYKECERCIGNEFECDFVYIALQGDKYHSTLACSGLKRTIYVITDSQIGGRRKCMRCG